MYANQSESRLALPRSRLILRSEALARPHRDGNTIARIGLARLRDVQLVRRLRSEDAAIVVGAVAFVIISWLWLPPHWISSVVVWASAAATALLCFGVWVTRFVELDTEEGVVRVPVDDDVEDAQAFVVALRREAHTASATPFR